MSDNSVLLQNYIMYYIREADRQCVAGKVVSYVWRQSEAGDVWSDPHSSASHPHQPELQPPVQTQH